MLNQTKGGKRVYFSGLKVSRSQIISSPSGATGKLWIWELGISQFLQECKFPIMICQGQHGQSARHKHGDYLIMKAEWCCSSGCELPAQGECREPDVRGWDAREGLARVTPAPEHRAETAAGGERAAWHPQPARTSPSTVGTVDERLWETTAPPGLHMETTPPLGDVLWVSCEGKGRTKEVGSSWTTPHDIHFWI